MLLNLGIRNVEEVHRQEFINWFKDKVRIILNVVTKNV